ncbi:MAG TPA: phosphotransferase, partial [Bacillales bacterium]|nr:phosphotransferase [Bacillales bacterium]
MEGEIIQDLSSPHTANRVFLFHSKRHGKIIKKEFGQVSHFKRAVEAMKVVDRSLHPAVYKMDMRRRCLYISYHPRETEPDSMDACAANLMKELHTSTRRYGGVSDPGTGQVYSSWKDYIRKRGSAAVESLMAKGDYRDSFEAQMDRLEDSPFAPVSYIHRDVRPDNIGERKGRYLLLDFEHAMVGDPYWDVARYAFESAQSKEDFYKLYGMDDQERADIYVWLFALDYAAYFVRHNQADSPIFEKCLAFLG